MADGTSFTSCLDDLKLKEWNEMLNDLRRYLESSSPIAHHDDNFADIGDQVLVSLSRFSGVNPVEWLSEAERYFDYYAITDDERFPYVIELFDDEPFRWFNFWHRKSQTITWEDFTTAMLNQFHVGALDEPQTDTSPIYASIESGTEVINSQSEGIKPLHYCFDEIGSTPQLSSNHFPSIIPVQVAPCPARLHVVNSSGIVMDGTCSNVNTESQMLALNFAPDLVSVANPYLHRDVMRLQPMGEVIITSSISALASPPTVSVFGASYATLDGFANFIVGPGLNFHVDWVRMNFSFDPGPLLPSDISIETIALAQCLDQCHQLDPGFNSLALSIPPSDVVLAPDIAASVINSSQQVIQLKYKLLTQMQFVRNLMDNGWLEIIIDALVATVFDDSMLDNYNPTLLFKPCINEILEHLDDLPFELGFGAALEIFEEVLDPNFGYSYVFAMFSILLVTDGSCTIEQRVGTHDHSIGSFVQCGNCLKYILVPIGALSFPSDFMENGLAFVTHSNLTCRDVILWNNLINGYKVFASLGEAKRLFVHMPKRSIVSWHYILVGFVQYRTIYMRVNCGQIEQTSTGFNSMPTADLLAGHTMFIGMEMNKHSHDSQKSCHLRQLEEIISTTITFVASLPIMDTNYMHQVNGCLQNGQLGEVAHISMGLVGQNVVSWSSRVDGYINTRGFVLNRHLRRESEIQLVLRTLTIVFVDCQIFNPSTAGLCLADVSEMLTRTFLGGAGSWCNLEHDSVHTMANWDVQMVDRSDKNINFDNMVINNIQLVMSVAPFPKDMHIHIHVHKHGMDFHLLVQFSLVSFSAKLGCVNVDSSNFDFVLHSTLSYTFIINWMTPTGHRETLALLVILEANAIQLNEPRIQHYGYIVVTLRQLGMVLVAATLINRLSWNACLQNLGELLSAYGILGFSKDGERVHMMKLNAAMQCAEHINPIIATTWMRMYVHYYNIAVALKVLNPLHTTYILAWHTMLQLTKKEGPNGVVCVPPMALIRQVSLEAKQIPTVFSILVFAIYGGMSKISTTGKTKSQLPLASDSFMDPEITPFAAIYGHQPLARFLHHSLGRSTTWKFELINIPNRNFILHLADKVNFNGGGNVMNGPTLQAQTDSPIQSERIHQAKYKKRKRVIDWGMNIVKCSVHLLPHPLLGTL